MGGGGADASPCMVFVREVAGFLAVVNIASYAFFATGAWIYLSFTGMIDPMRDLRYKKVTQPVSSSEWW